MWNGNWQTYWRAKTAQASKIFCLILENLLNLKPSVTEICVILFIELLSNPLQATLTHSASFQLTAGHSFYSRLLSKHNHTLFETILGPLTNSRKFSSFMYFFFNSNDWINHLNHYLKKYLIMVSGNSIIFYLVNKRATCIEVSKSSKIFYSLEYFLVRSYIFKKIVHEKRWSGSCFKISFLASVTIQDVFIFHRFNFKWK